MNIYRHEFKMSLRSVINWSITQVLIIFIVMSLFSSIAADAALLNDMMAQFPPELLAAFGMTNLNWDNVLGFFSFVFVFVQVCLAVQAANYGFGLLSVEERSLTADFLLAKPVSRNQILTNKLLAALTGLLLTDVVACLSSLAAVYIFRDGREVDAAGFALLLLSIIPFQLFFLAVGMVISLLVRRVRSVTPYSMALVFGLYVINAFGNMLGRRTFEVISPFLQFEPNAITATGALDPLVWISVVIIAVSLAGSYVLYGRRNIASPS